MKAPALRAPTLLQAQRWAGTGAAVFAFVGCAVSGELGSLMVGLFPLGLLLSFLVRDRLRGRGEWAWTALLVGALILFAAQVIAGQVDIVLGAAWFVELLCIHRLWHRRNERDELLLLLLSLLLLCAGAALAAELTFGLAFMAFAVTGTWALALTHLRFAIEEGRGQAGSAALLNSRRIATPALLGGLALLSTLSIVGAALVFFTFPRVTIGGWRRASRPSPVAGLGDGIDLSQHGTIEDDPRVVLRVRLDPPPRGEPEDLAMHWRARALSHWTGQGWRSEGGGIIPARRLPTRTHKGRPPAILTADVEVVGQFGDGVVLTPQGWPLSVDFRKPGSTRPGAQRLYRNASGDLFYQPVDGNDLRYLVMVDTAEPDIASLRGRGQRYPPWLGPELAVPKDLSPRVLALARRLGENKDPADAAAAIERWLYTALRYTRELPGTTADPIADFLFVRRAGHCELFSSAMVIMLRSLGIPARNVTGYFGGRRTDAGYYAVRAGDAHSWVEVWFPEAGFVRFDPTPASSRGSRQDGLWPRAVLLWDAMQQRWRAFVVDYDLLSQAQAMRRVAQLFDQAGSRLAGKRGGRLRALTLALAVALAGVGLVAAVRRLRSRGRRGPAPALSRTQQRALRLWRRARSRLRRAGLEVPPGATARELAHRIPAAAEAADAYAGARWGDTGLTSAQARAVLHRLDDALRGRVAPDAPA
jgi:transglutaminase-like putative cysteine protease